MYTVWHTEQSEAYYTLHIHHEHVYYHDIGRRHICIIAVIRVLLSRDCFSFGLDLVYFFIKLYTHKAFDSFNTYWSQYSHFDNIQNICTVVSESDRSGQVSQVRVPL